MTLNNTKLYMLNKEEVIEAVEKTADSNLNCELLMILVTLYFPVFAMCMCIFVSRVFHIRKL